MERYFQDKAMDKGKRDRTRAVLIDSVINVAWEKGAAQTTVHDITKRSGLAQGTLYNHFEGIEELVSSAAAEVAMDFEQRIEERVGCHKPGGSRLVKAVKANIEIALENERHGSLFVDAVLNAAKLRKIFDVHLQEDVDACLKAGHTKLAYTDLLANQCGATVAVAISRQLNSRRSKTINLQTCEAVLRLIGFSPSRAATLVSKSF